MKKFIIFLVLFMPSCLFAQDRSKADFENDLKFIESAIKNFNKKNFYKSFEFKHNKTGNVKKLDDFTNLELNVFYMLQAERLTKNLSKIQKEWEGYLEGIDDAAIIEDVKMFIERLNNLRKELAIKYEILVNKMLQDFPDDFTKEEKKHIIESIKKYHDENELIKRN